MEEKTEKILKGLGIAACGAVLVGAGMGIGATAFPKTIELTETIEVPVETIVTETVEVPVEVEKIVEIEVPVNVTVEKIIEVEDEEMLKLMCDRLMYDDLSDCRKEIEAEEAALKLALAEIELDLGDDLEDAGIIEDEDEFDLIRVYDDYEDIKVVKSDYDDEEYRFKIDIKVEDEETDEKKTVTYTIDVEDGDVDIVSIKE